MTGQTDELRPGESSGCAVSIKAAGPTSQIPGDLVDHGDRIPLGRAANP